MLTRYLLLLLGCIIFTQVTLAEEPGDLQQIVVERFAALKENTDATAWVKAMSLTENANRVLPYAIMYITDENPSVRELVSNIAVRASTLESDGVLVALIRDNDQNVREHTLYKLIAKHDATECVSIGGKQLRDNLICCLNQYGDREAEILLILGNYLHDKVACQFMQSLKKRPIDTVYSHYAILQYVNRDVAIDLACANMGDEESIELLKKELKQNDLNNAYFFAYSIPYLSNKEILGLLVELLHDKHPIKEDQKTGIKKRVCDIALYALAKKGNIEIVDRTGTEENYSDEEITRIYSLLRKVWD